MTLPSDWERCKPWIEASTAFPLAESIEAIERKLVAGSYTLAASPNAAAVVEFTNYGGRNVLLIRICGGDLGELLDVIEPELYAYAKATDRLMMSEGRLGWLKPAKARGYKLAWITMVKE